MPLQNAEIAAIFNEVADLLEIRSANPFRVRAYRNAARTVENWPVALSSKVRAGEELPKLPGLGADLAGKVGEICGTGRLALLEELRRQVPEGLIALLRIPGLGPKRVRLLETKLRIRSREDLEHALARGELLKLRGFGPKLEARIREDLHGELRPERLRLATVEPIAQVLLAYLSRGPGVLAVEAAGSFRRCAETIGDLDLLASSDLPSGVMEWFLSFEDVARTLSRGQTRSSVVLRSGLQVDLRVVPPKSWGSALHYFTGSKAHNIAVRSIGVRGGLKINEYGVFKGARRIAGQTEAEVFRSVGLQYIEPELRENRGEIEAAREGRLPRLVTFADLKGDLHAHTRETDGKSTLEEMARAARERGYQYLAITDHSRHLSVARGLTPARLRRQIQEIRRFNESSPGIRILCAIEVDILEDGKLDLPADVLRLLDLTVCSIHSRFELSSAKQTERILRAMDNPCFNVLGHPTGRLSGSRRPYEVEMERVLIGARDRGCVIEINSQPERMDLPDTLCQLAKELGTKLVISSDAHSVHELDYLRYGVSQARRGWLEASDVLNTLPWGQLKKALRRRA